MKLNRALRSIINRTVFYLSKIFIFTFRYASPKWPFRTLLKYVPSSVLTLGDKLASRSIDQSVLSQPGRGSIGLIIESGALKIILLNMMAKERLGLSKLICYDERKKNWNEAGMLEELAKDDETKVIIMCLESIRSGRQFMHVARDISKKKPIIVLKSGKSRVGARAVMSHVGFLAGADEICNAAFKQSGILRAQTIEDVLDFAKALSFQTTAKGSRIAILTNGGGAGIVAADACLGKGLEVPSLSRSVQKCFRRKIPLFSGTTNPLDLRASATAEVYANAINCLLVSDDVDLIMLMVYPTPALDINRFVSLVLKLQRKLTKPLVVCGTGSEKFINRLLILERSHIPVYILPERAVSGAAALVYFGRVQGKIK